MISRFYPLVILSVALPLSAAQPGQLDASEPLFTVMAAANAAGYNAGLASSTKLRQQVRERVEATHAPVLLALREWYRSHPEPDKTRDLARFLSLGLSVKGAPDFQWSTRDVEVPPDALAMNEFRKLLPEFYAQAKVDDLWKASQPAIDTLLQSIQEPIARVVMEANAYLRQSATSGFLGRNFQIFVDFLGAPNQVQTRSYGDSYFVVLTQASQPPIFAIRHAYYRYAVDPLAIKFGMELKEKGSLMDIAERAPLLGEQYRTDFGLLATECLIKAIESRQSADPSAVSEALREGYILTPFFNEQLAIYEKQPASMKIFFPEMVKALSVRREIKRLDGVEFATVLPQRPTASSPVVAQAPGSIAAQTAAQADDAYYEKKDLEEARKLYERSLEQAGTATDHSKAYYGLAHIALKQKNPETAEQLFRKTLESAPEPETQAWSYYYLGKLSAISDQSDQAQKWYELALAVKGASAKALESTRAGLADLHARAK